MKYIIENGFLVSAKVEEKEVNGRKLKFGKLMVREAIYDEEKCMASDTLHFLDCPADKVEIVKDFTNSKVKVEGILRVNEINKEGKTLRYYRFICDSIDKID